MEDPQAPPVCEFPLLRRRFLAAAGWLEDAPRPRPAVPLMNLARPQTAPTKQAGALPTDVQFGHRHESFKGVGFVCGILILMFAPAFEVLVGLCAL